MSPLAIHEAIAETGHLSNILYQNAPTEKLAFDDIFRKLQKLFPPNNSKYCVYIVFVCVTFPWFQPN